MKPRCKRAGASTRTTAPAVHLALEEAFIALLLSHSSVPQWIVPRGFKHGRPDMQLSGGAARCESPWTPSAHSCIGCKRHPASDRSVGRIEALLDTPERCDAHCA